MLKCDLNYRDLINKYECVACIQKPYCPFPYPQPPCACCCTGPAGPQGPAGAAGKSAYQIALDNGYAGTEIEWLKSLKGEAGPAGPFLSSYIEAIGSTQTIDTNKSVVFDTDPDVIDIAGKDIEIDAAGAVFTIRRSGLYHVEWSVNLASAGQPVVICLLENGDPMSGFANSSSSGNLSSGALINVDADSVPFTVSLHNFGAPVSIENPATILNSAVSMRILRFADGPAA